MPQSRFSKVVYPRTSGNRTSGDVVLQLGGLDMSSPQDLLQNGRTPDAKNFRLYKETEEGGRQAAVVTRKGAGFYTVPLSETLSASNTSSTGASTAQVGVETNMHLQPFTATNNDRLVRLDMHIAQGTASSVVRVDIYDDDNGTPSKLITRSSFQAVPDVADWVTARFINSPDLTNGEQYWIVTYIQDDGAGSALLTTTTTAPLAYVSNAGVIGGVEATYGTLFRTYTAPGAEALGGYRFNRDDSVNRTLVPIGTTMYYVDEVTNTLLPLKTGLSANAIEYSFTNGDGRVFWANGFDPVRMWTGYFEADNPNLITNGDFEVNTSGWTTAGTGGTLTATRSTAQFRTGVASLSVTAASGQRGAKWAMSMDPGVEYHITAWVKGATAASNVYMYLYGPNIAIPGTTVSQTTSWQKIEVTYTPTVATVTSLALLSDGNNFFIDDVEIKKTGFEEIFDSELPVLKEITFHKDRLFGVTMTDKNKIVFSEAPGNPTNSPTNQQWYRQWLSVSFVYVPRPFNGSPITSITSFQDNLVITTQDSKYVLSGTDRGNMFLRQSTGSKGALSRRGVIADPNFMYLVASDGIYRFNGAKDEKISVLIQPLFENCPRKHEIALALWNNTVRAYMSSQFATENDITAIYTNDFNEWMLDTETYVSRAIHYDDADDQDELIEFSSQTGTLYNAEQDLDNLGAPIDFDYRLKYDSRGMPGQKKKYKKFVPLVQAVGKPFPIVYGTDTDFEGTPREKLESLSVGGAKIGDFFIDDGTIITGATAYKPRKTSISGNSYYMQFRVRRDGVGNQVAFMGVQFTYKAKKL